LNESAIFTKRTHLENRRKANNGAGQSEFLAGQTSAPNAPIRSCVPRASIIANLICINGNEQASYSMHKPGKRFCE
jgi:hypothetical protein